jgi:hypothetical protein
MTTSPNYIFLLLFASLCTPNAWAEKIYTSRGENGNLVFSDKPVAGGKVLGVRQVEVARGPCFSVAKRGEKDDLQIHGVNECFGPVEYQFTLDEAENIASDRPRTFTTIIGSRQNQSIVRLWQADRRKGYRYTYTQSFVVGDPAARHLPSQPYLLPVPADQSFRVSQSFHGQSTHTHPQSEYAVDIPMPEGTRIHTARSGVIMNVAHDFFTGGKGAQFTEKANFIRILHDDGTMALYAHLKVESIQYPVGARVARGQFIAESGNTGYSSGPHLHFTVQKNFGMELRSIPFEFADSRGGGFVPEAGMVVRR